MRPDDRDLIGTVLLVLLLILLGIVLFALLPDKAIDPRWSMR